MAVRHDTPLSPPPGADAGPGELQALETHVAGCGVCQDRLDQLTRGAWTLPPPPSGPEPGREDTPMPGGVLERVATFLPAQVRFMARRDEAGRAIETAGHAL